MKYLVYLRTVCAACLQITLTVACLGATSISSSWAQTIYRCADTYSHENCDGGIAILADDARTPAQKADTDRAAQRDATLAAQMEENRLKQQAQAAAKYPSKARTSAPAAKRRSENAPSGLPLKPAKTVHKPEFFTAHPPSNGAKPEKSNENDLGKTAIEPAKHTAKRPARHPASASSTPAAKRKRKTKAS